MPRVISHKSPRKGGTFIATPAYSGVLAPYVQSLFSSQEKFHEKGINTSLEILTENCHVDDGRNILVRDFLESDCEQLVFLDTDISWHSDDLIRLIESPRDIIAGIYPLKEKNEAYPVRLFQGEQYAEDDGMLEVEGVPTGFLKIRRNVLEVLAEKAKGFRGQREGDGRMKIPLIFERTIDDIGRWGGDYTFCLKARASGFKIYIDPEMEFSHYGEQEWSGRYGDYIRGYNNIANPRLIEHINKLINGDVSEKLFIDIHKAWSNDLAGAPGLLMACHDIAKEGSGPILECGAGITTIILGLTGRQVYSLESDFMWYRKVRYYIEKFNLTNVHIQYSKLKEYGDYTFYDIEDLPTDVRFDLALIDGPCRAIGRKGFYELFDTSEMTLIVDDAETEAHFVDGRDNIQVGGHERPFIVSKPLRRAA